MSAYGTLSFWKFKFGASKTKREITESLTQMNDIEVTQIKCDTLANTLEDQHLQRLKDKIACSELRRRDTFG